MKYLIRAVVGAAVLISGISLAQDDESRLVSFRHIFTDGYYMVSGRSETAPLTTYTGWSQNMTPNDDGTVSKRAGTSLDNALAGADTSVNGLFSLQNSISYYPNNWGFAVVGNKFFSRDNQTDVWTEVTAPAMVKTNGQDRIQATEYDGQLIIGGDISHLMRFDGYNLSRLHIPVPLDSTTGSIDTLQVGTGALSALTAYDWFWSWVNDNGDETYFSGLLSLTTTATALAGSISGLPLYPLIYEDQSDTATNIVARYMYRSTDGGLTGNFIKRLSARDTTFVDSGQYGAGSAVSYRTRIQNDYGSHPTEYADQLWINLGTPAHRSEFTLATAMTSTFTGGSGWNFFAVSPSLTSKDQVGKVYLDKDPPILGGIAVTWLYPGDGNSIALATGAQFITKGVVPGDYFVQKAPSTGVGKPAYRVLSVFSEIQLYVEGIATESGTIGNNIFKVDDEYIGIAQAVSSSWKVGESDDWENVAEIARGLFGTTPAAHGVGTALELVNPRVGDRASAKVFYRTENFNALRFQTQDPFFFDLNRATGMWTGNGYLGTTGPNDSYAIRGTDPFYATTVAQGVGSIAPPFADAGGAYVLDDRGPYFITDEVQTFLGHAVEDGMRDSTQTNFYDDAAISVHDGRLYISLVKDATLNTIVYVADRTRQTTFGGPVWTRYTQMPARSWSIFEEENFIRSLYFGSWKEGAVFKFDPSVAYDESSASAQGSITTVLVTPADRIPGYDVNWQRVVLTADTNDSLTMTAYYGDGGVEYSEVIGAWSASDSTSSPGRFRDYIAQPGITSEYLFLEVKQTSATSRLTIAEITIEGERIGRR